MANAVRVLSALFLAIHPPAIEDVARCSVEWGTDPKDMLGDAFLRRTLERETERRCAKGARDVFTTRDGEKKKVTCSYVRK